MSNFFLDLPAMGWHPFFEAYYAELAAELSVKPLVPARIVAGFQDLYRVAFVGGEAMAELSGRFRYQLTQATDWPAVGDWVLLHWPETAQPDQDRGVIHGVLPRRSAFSRVQAGTQGKGQVVAANVDTLWVVTSLNHDLNLRRIERYLTLAWESRAEPVIVLNKADSAGEDLAAALAALQGVALGCEVLAVSALHQRGLSQLEPWLKPGHTLAMVGSSGVGKSTLLNALMGTEAMATGSIRVDDSKGKHTTTHRELFRLPQGAWLMDTPGMRELRLTASEHGLAMSFEDIDALAQQCRFRNCHHGEDVGCAVQAAIDAGELAPERLASFVKQHKENDWQLRRESPELRARSKQRFKHITKAMRKQAKGSSPA